MIATVFLSFGRSRPLLLSGLSVGRSLKAWNSFFRWPFIGCSRCRALSFCSFVGGALSLLNPFGVQSPDEGNRLLRAGVDRKRVWL
jgi:hypothetical protein